MSTLGRVRERTFSWEDPLAAVSAAADMPGLQVMEAVMEGKISPPPIARLLDLSIIEVSPGRAVFAMQAAEWMYNPLGTVHGGVAATLLDSCMGCAVHTTLEAGVSYTTTDLQVRYIRALTEGSGRVLAEGKVVHRGRRTATAEGRFYLESDEKLLAHGTAGCVILG